jgi:hypothetical protein
MPAHIRRSVLVTSPSARVCEGHPLPKAGCVCKHLANERAITTPDRAFLGSGLGARNCRSTGLDVIHRYAVRRSLSDLQGGGRRFEPCSAHKATAQVITPGVLRPTPTRTPSGEGCALRAQRDVLLRCSVRGHIGVKACDLGWSKGMALTVRGESG